MASSRHKTHKGREFNMAAFVDRNAETRAIGNVPMNARGDIVDSKGNVKVTAGQIAKGLSHVNDKKSKTVSIKEDSASKPKKSKKGNRLFTPDDIANFKLIFNLVKERGFTLDGAKQKLKENPEGVVNNHEIISRLEAVKAELNKIKNQL